MARCSECGCQFQTLPDEEGDHPCPGCGFHPSNWADSPEEWDKMRADPDSAWNQRNER